MESIKMLNDLANELNNDGINGFVLMEEEYKQKRLFNKINYDLFSQYLRSDLEMYLDYLFKDQNNYRYFKKIQLEEITKKNIRDYQNYYKILKLLTYYTENPEAYRNLPVLIYSLIKKLNLKNYKYLTFEDIKAKIYENYDLKELYDFNAEKNICEILYKLSPQDYNDIDQYYDCSDYHKTPQNIFWKWAEKNSYEDELRKNNLYYYPFKPIWVAREKGDGYGYDILSYDISKYKEKLIEVKTNRIYITDTELEVMRNCYYKNAIYTLQFYAYLNDIRIYNKAIFNYNSNYDILTDEYNQIYNIIGPFTQYDEINEREKKYYTIKPDENNKIKSIILAKK